MPNEVIQKQRDEAAKCLAQSHYQIEEGITDIFQILDHVDVEIVPVRSDSSQPIMLLEVNQNTVPSGIMPIQFGANPASGMFYPSVIVEVTPDEYAEIRAGNLQLPNGWEVGPRIQQPE